MIRFWDPRAATWCTFVVAGELYITEEDEMIMTLLGSCVAVCARDRRRHRGGLNHFVLPHAGHHEIVSPCTELRYGNHAVARLVALVLHEGGRRDDLEISLFGGGRVLHAGADVGETNIAYARRFCAAHHLAIGAEDVGGTVARRLRYWPARGLVEVTHTRIDSS